jgi:DNA-binding transcriptional MocR family regulator
MDYMSYIRLIRSSDLTTSEKITAIMIASHYDFSKKDPAWPSNKTLAKETGLSVRSIIRAKKVLTESHYLVSQRQWNSVCLLIPTDPMSQGVGHNGDLNTHINTHINNKRNTHINNNESSYEDSYEVSNTKDLFPGEIITLEENNIGGQSSLADIKAQAASPWEGWR